MNVMACNHQMAGHHYQHSYSRWATSAHTYAPPQSYFQIPRQLSVAQGPYYGYESVARLCTRFIRSLFTCPLKPGQQSLSQFIAYAVHRSKVHPSITFSSLLLLQRLKTHYPQANGSSGHELFIITLMIASKVLNDTTFSNSAWVIVAQNQFTHRVLNQMERQMCDYLHFEVAVFGPMLDKFEGAVKRDFCEDRASYPTYTYDMVATKRGTRKRAMSEPMRASSAPPAGVRAPAAGVRAPAAGVNIPSAARHAPAAAPRAASAAPRVPSTVSYVPPAAGFARPTAGIVPSGPVFGPAVPSYGPSAVALARPSHSRRERSYSVAPMPVIPEQCFPNGTNPWRLR